MTDEQRQGSNEPHWHPPVTVPDDASSLTDDDLDGMWHMHERLVLSTGDEFVRTGAAFPYEPHLGDVMGSSGHRVTQALAAAAEDGVLRWQPASESLMFVPIGNVTGIYVDVYAPDGEPILGDDLKPGYNNSSTH